MYHDLCLSIVCSKLCAQELEAALREIEEASKEPPRGGGSTAPASSDGGGVGTDGVSAQSSNLSGPHQAQHASAAVGEERDDPLEEADGDAAADNQSPSQYTCAFLQLMDASLRVSTNVKLLPSEFDEMPSIHENEHMNTGGVNVMDALREAQIKQKVSALDSLNATRATMKVNVTGSDDSSEASSDDAEEEVVEELDIQGYGLEVAYQQLQTIYNTINLEEPEKEEGQPLTGRGAARRKVELGVLLNAGGDLLAALGVDEHGNLLGKKKKKKSGFSSSDDTSSGDSDDSDASSRSYLKGVDRYRTRKQLQNAIVRRREKLKSLHAITKKLQKKLNKVNKQLAEMKGKRANSYTRVIKAMEGDVKTDRPRVLFQSDVEMNSLREENLKLMAEGKKWKRRLTNLLEAPQEGIVAAKKKLSSAAGTASDGISLRVVMRPSIVDGQTPPSSQDAVRKSSQSSSDSTSMSSLGMKPLSGYSEKVSREQLHSSTPRQEEFAPAHDNESSMTESMSTVLSLYQKVLTTPLHRVCRQSCLYVFVGY